MSTKPIKFMEKLKNMLHSWFSVSKVLQKGVCVRMCFSVCACMCFVCVRACS